jgi:hypothetical protein
MESDIDKFIGDWANEEESRLVIRKTTSRTGIVSFLTGPNGMPVVRPYSGDLPSTRMHASLRDYGSTIEVELWGPGKGFTLHLTYEYAYELDKQHRDSLIPALSRYDKDEFLEQYYSLFGRLKHYTRASAGQHPIPHRGKP